MIDNTLARIKQIHPIYFEKLILILIWILFIYFFLNFDSDAFFFGAWKIEKLKKKGLTCLFAYKDENILSVGKGSFQRNNNRATSREKVSQELLKIVALFESRLAKSCIDLVNN